MSENHGRSSTVKRKLKARLFGGKQTAKCCFCHRPLTMATATLEHIVPLEAGVNWHITNLRISCDQCNQERGTQDFGQFREKVRRRCQTASSGC